MRHRASWMLLIVSAALVVTGLLIPSGPVIETEQPLLTGEVKVEIMPGHVESMERKYICAVYTLENGKRGLITPALQIEIKADSVYYSQTYVAWDACQQAITKAGISTTQRDIKRYPGLWSIQPAKPSAKPNGTRA